MPVTVRRAHLDDEADADAIVALTDAYARDPMGGGQPLPDTVMDELVPAMREHGKVHVWLAEHTERGRQPVGILTAIVKFSTFAASSTLNVHDIAVLDEHRGAGIGARLIDSAEAWAREQGFARLSLEVLDENPARRLYERQGFEHKSTYMVKPLTQAGESYADER
jgi:GNAT superfamily N-acetyltransferase